MKKSILLLATILTVFTLASAEVLTSFPDMVKPTELRVDDKHIYIADQNSVFVYDKATFKLVKKLSKKGEGPGELKNHPRISLTREGLILNDSRKIIIYTNAFDIKKEIRLLISTERANPIGDHFVLYHSEEINKKPFRVFSLYNSKPEKVKDLVLQPEDPEIAKYLLFPWSRCRTWKDKIFIAQPRKGFYIDVFDKTGEKVYRIEKKVENILAREDHRNLYKAEMLSFIGRRRFEMLKARGMFDRPMKKYVPDMNNFWVTDNRIYVKTYELKDRTEKYVIMDIKGNTIKTVFLPWSFKELLAFNNNTFYYLEDSEEEESWVLHTIRF